MNAVRRMLWRRGHAEKSGCFACSIDQLALALAPVMDWPPAPPKEEPFKRARWLANRRKSVRRWLDDMQEAGLIAYEGQDDNRGQQWRTVITLLEPPTPDREDLERVRRRDRRKRWRRARQRRRRQQRPKSGARRPQRPLWAIENDPRARSVGPAERERLATRRSCAVRQARRAAPDSSDHGSHLTHPFGGPATAGPSPSQNQHVEAPLKDAHARAGPVSDGRPPGRNGCVSSVKTENDLGTEERKPAGVPDGSWLPAFGQVDGGGHGRGPVVDEQWLAELTARVERNRAQHREAFERLKQWPADWLPPVDVVAQAYAHVVDGSPVGVSAQARQRLERAAGRWARYVEQRPKDWPENAAGALARCLRLTRSAARGPGFAIGALDDLSKDMAAKARRDDREHAAERMLKRITRQATDAQAPGDPSVEELRGWPTMRLRGLALERIAAGLIDRRHAADVIGLIDRRHEPSEDSVRPGGRRPAVDEQGRYAGYGVQRIWLLRLLGVPRLPNEDW